MPAARAARSLDPTATTRRPQVVREVATAATITIAIASQTVLEIPRVLSSEKEDTAAGARVGVPPEYASAAPTRAALTASVATSGVTENRVMTSPFTSPTTTAMSATTSSAATTLSPCSAAY